MDASGLRSRIQATLSADADVRRQAEAELKQVSYHAPNVRSKLVAD